MTGGFDESYGSASSSQAPTEGPDEERSSIDDDFDARETPSGVEAEVPRHTRPFRAWGAAHEAEKPSLWARLVGWVRSIFSRKEATPSPAPSVAMAEHRHHLFGGAATAVAPADASGEALAPVEASALEAAVLAHDDFATTAAPEADVIVVEETVAVAEVPADADPLWDEPVVMGTAPAEPPALAEQDFAEVWAPPAQAEEAESVEAVQEPPKKGFFARLFSRKKDGGAQADSGAQGDKDVAPADADFAEDIAASAAPAADDFAVEAPSVHDFADAPAADDFAEDFATSAPTPSSLVDHSAEDSANLAALLGVVPPSEPVDDAPTERFAAAVDDTVDPSLTLDPVPDPELAAEVAPLVPPPEPEDVKKAGFFSGLLKRVSRSMFVPKAALPPEPPPMPAMELADAAPAVDEVTEVASSEQVTHEELEAKWGAPPAAPSDEDLGETVPTPMPAVPHPMAEVQVPRSARDDKGSARDDKGSARDDSDIQATQPFPAFRDARDDFAEEEAQESGRPTEKVAVPAFDDGEKTDEFEVVAPVPEGTAETRQVAGFWGRMFGKKAEEQVATPDSGEVAATLAPTDDKTPFVLAKFRTFYNEVIRDKHQKSDVISGFATAVMGSGSATETNDPEFAAQLLSKRLSEMLELQAAESNWTGGDAAKYYPEAQYAMVALADETFATIDWPGRSSWHKYMLEPRMYGTRGADIEFFKRIDKLLKEAPNEKGARDLARLYLLVIASGYRGKFRVPNVRRPLAEYRRRLYEYSHQADPLELYGRDRRIFPAAVEHTLASRAVGRFTSAQKWIATVLILVVLYLGYSHFAWSRLSADLKDIMSRIENTEPTGRTP